MADTKKVAKPEPKVHYATPDDAEPVTNLTWREYLEDYNKRFRTSGDNPNGLCDAATLSKPAIYQQLCRYVGKSNLYILSAGWGLVRADCLLPKYDITFSLRSEVPPESRRREADFCDDFAQLTQEDIASSESVYFFGALPYLPAFYYLTSHLHGRIVIYHTPKTEDVVKETGYEYIHYPKTGSNGRPVTNWQYECAKDFMAGTLRRE